MPLSDEYYRRRYSKLYEGHYVGLLKKPHWIFYELDLINLLNLTGEEIVLDAGCGIGVLSWELAKHARRVIGVDSSDRAIKMAREKFQRRNLFFIRADILELNLDLFDRIICIDVIEHVHFQDLIDLLNKFNALLKRRGLLLIKFPSQGGFGNLVHALRGYETVDYTGDWTHKWRVKENEIVLRKLKEADFEVTKIIKIPFFTSWLTSLKLVFIKEKLPEKLQDYFRRAVYVLCTKP